MNTMEAIEALKERINNWTKGGCNGKLEIEAGDYRIIEAAQDTYEVEINNVYFISVGKLSSTKFEVFTLHYNVDTKTSWDDWSNIPAEKDHLAQHKCFTSWKRAFNYALRSVSKRETPREINKMW